MHIGNWVALTLVGLLLVASVIAAVRARRRRRSPPQHRPAGMREPMHDQTAIILIGTVAADGARSSLG